MSRLATSFVLGYHGCDAKVAEAIIAGAAELNPSQNDFDWLGHGAYFWEADPRRALEYAENRVGKGEFDKAAIVGAVIDLRNCLDLTNRQDLDLVEAAYHTYVNDRQISGLPVIRNKNVKNDPAQDMLLRYLDCAVINYLHYLVGQSDEFESFDTVRGLFSEGKELYPGAGFSAKTHTQIAVRSMDCIIGYFLPRNLETT